MVGVDIAEVRMKGKRIGCSFVVAAAVYSVQRVPVPIETFVLEGAGNSWVVS